MAAGATGRREDVRAAGQSIEATRALLAGAERNTLPQLDLRLSVGYEGGFDDDRLDALARALGSNVQGLNAGASLALELPLRNDARKALRDFQSAELSRRESARDNLERQVRVGVAIALDDLRLTAEALAAAEQAASRYARAIDDERTKLEGRPLDGDRRRVHAGSGHAGRAGPAAQPPRIRAGTGPRALRGASKLPSDEAQVGERVRLVLDAQTPGGADGRR